jgi:hypothetical protein
MERWRVAGWVWVVGALACHPQVGPQDWSGAPTHKITLDSSPRGALVLRGDQILCRSTPCALLLPEGEHRLSPPRWTGS